MTELKIIIKEGIICPNKTRSREYLYYDGFSLDESYNIYMDFLHVAGIAQS